MLLLEILFSLVASVFDAKFLEFVYRKAIVTMNVALHIQTQTHTHSQTETSYLFPHRINYEMNRSEKCLAKSRI